MRFSPDITGYFLQVKSENLYISDVRKIILHVVSMWDMKIPPSGQNFWSGTRHASSLTRNSVPQVEFPYPTSIQIKDSISIHLNRSLGCIHSSLWDCNRTGHIYYNDLGQFCNCLRMCTITCTFGDIPVCSGLKSELIRKVPELYQVVYEWLSQFYYSFCTDL
jgi:hypothetical protein